MTTTTTLFPNETIAYREARERLLAAEIELKDARERVAEMRRELPIGPVVSTDYRFKVGPRDLSQSEPVTEVGLAELFGEHDSLILVNYMFGPDDDAPCPMCTMWADGYDAVAPHMEQRAGFALVAAAGLEKLRAVARARGWRNIRLLSSQGTSFNRDYHSENERGDQTPGVTVFRREPDGTIRLHYYTEMMIAGKTPPISGQNERGIDLFTPVWNLLDLLPEGRGDWYPSLTYDRPDKLPMLGVDIHHTTLIRADIERVWHVLTTAEGLNEWFTTGASWTQEPGSAMHWRWEHWAADDISDTATGEIVAVEPLRRFVFTWENGSEAGQSTVAMSFTEVDGGTRVELTDSGYPDTPRGRDSFNSCATGWGEALTLAKFYAEHGLRY